VSPATFAQEESKLIADTVGFGKEVLLCAILENWSADGWAIPLTLF